MTTLNKLACALCLVVAAAAGDAQTPLYSYTVPAGGYAPNGNVTGYTDSVTGTWTMQYDALNRLQNATASAGAYQGINLQWQYDSFGNRLSQTPSGHSTALVPGPWTASYIPSDPSKPPNNQMTLTSAGTPKYDAAGNVTFDGQATHVAYDAENRVCATMNTVLNPGMTQYIYNAEGQRVAKGYAINIYINNPDGLPFCPTDMSNFAVTATYVLGPSGEQMTEFDSSGAWQHTNVFNGGQLLATYDTRGLHFPQTDPLGTVRVQVSDTGTPEKTCASLPFGDGLTCTGITDPTEHHFTGKERDAESGLDYFGARYYASNMGRWMSPDWDSSPVAIPYADRTNPQSFNLYSYVGNNPLSRTDPDGHCTNGGAQKGFWWCLFNDSDQDAAYARQQLAQYKNISINGKTPADAAKGLNNTQTVQLNRSVFNYISSQVMSSPGMMLGLALVPGAAEELIPAEAAAADSGSLLNLNKSLASQEQMGELAAGKGQPILGAGTGKPLSDVTTQRLSSEYGGNPGDWQKVSSGNYNPGGAKGGGFETHAYQNVKTGQVVEMKSKMQ